jgi:hypothetical protein
VGGNGGLLRSLGDQRAPAAVRHTILDATVQDRGTHRSRLGEPRAHPRGVWKQEEELLRASSAIPGDNLRQFQDGFRTLAADNNAAISSGAESFGAATGARCAARGRGITISAETTFRVRPGRDSYGNPTFTADCECGWIGDRQAAPDQSTRQRWFAELDAEAEGLNHLEQDHRLDLGVEA